MALLARQALHFSATAPLGIGRPPWCCPKQTGFWRPGCASWRSACWKLVRLPGIAPGRPPWQGDILLLNHNREIKRAGSAIAPPAHAISTKNKHFLVIYAIPTRSFMAVVSVFMGTPPAKPLICKSVSKHSGALLSDRWADPNGGKFLLSCT